MNHYLALQFIGITLLGLSVVIFAAALPVTPEQEYTTPDAEVTKNCTTMYNECIENIDQGEAYVEVCNNTLQCVAGYFDCMGIQYTNDVSFLTTALPTDELSTAA